MAGNLLDALKSAGLADAKKAKKIEHEKKQQQHKDLKSGAVKAAPPEPEKVEDIKKQAVIQTEKLVQDRLESAYRGAALSDIAGRKKFYFTTVDQCIDCMMLSEVAAALLDRGKYAIVANLAMDDYLLVRRATALAIEAIDKKRVIVLKRQEK